MGMTKLVQITASLFMATALFGAPSHAETMPPNSQALMAYQAKNFREAMRIYRPLAEKGDAEAQYYVGRMYEKGEGVRKDEREVVKWYHRSAEGGYAAAQYRLAVGYAFGLAGLSRNQDEAAKWLHKAAEGGHKKAQRYLGRAYAEGRFGLPTDRKRAEYWSQRAETGS